MGRKGELVRMAGLEAASLPTSGFWDGQEQYLKLI